MKNKDYVSQPKQKKGANRKETQNDRRPFPIIKFTIVLGLIGAFAYFLFFLNKQDTTDVVTPAPKEESKTKPQREIPPPPENEEWSFIEELENKDVKVAAEELKDKGPFKMQCASLRSEQQANSLKAQIALAGYESQVIKSTGSNGVWYKVVLGPFEKKREAEVTRRVLRNNNINYCEIWLWR